MTYADHLAKESLAIRFLFEVAGVDHVFTTFRPPAAWLSAGELLMPATGGGTERRQWLPMLEVPSGTKANAQGLRPKGGLPRGASWKVYVKLEGRTSGWPATDPLRDYLTQHSARSDADSANKHLTYLTEDIKADDTGVVIRVQQNKWPGSAGSTILYCGRETLRASRSTSNVQTGVITGRGLYGSQPLPHITESPLAGADSPEAIPNGLAISSYLRGWRGRICRLWHVTGYLDLDGRFVPYGADDSAGVTTDHHSPRLTGVLWDLDESDPSRVEFNVKTLHARLGDPLIQRVPTLVPAHPDGADGRPMVYVDSHNNVLRWDVLVKEPIPFVVLTVDGVTNGDSVSFGGGLVTLTAATSSNFAGDIFSSVGSDSAVATSIANCMIQGASAAKFSHARAVGNRVVAVWSEDGTGIEVTGTPPRLTVSASDLTGLRTQTGLTSQLKSHTGGNLPSGLHSVSDVARAIQATLSQHGVSQDDRGLPPGFYVIADGLAEGAARLDYEEESGGANVIIPTRLWYSGDLDLSDIVPVGTFGSVRESVTFYIHGRYGSRETVIRYLGWSEDAESEHFTDDEASFGRAAIIADDPVPRWRWPATYSIDPPHTIYVQPPDAWTQAVLSAGPSRYRDDDDALVPYALMLDGVELLQWSALVESGGRWRLTGVARWSAVPPTTEPTSHAESYASAAQHQLAHVVPYFGPDQHLLRTMLYMLLAGTGDGVNHATYDQGIPGSGLYIRADLVDVDAIEALAREKPMATNCVTVRPGESFSDVFEDACILYGCQPVVDAQGRLTVVLLDGSPQEIDLEVPTALDQTVLRVPSDGYEFQRLESYAVNRVKVDIRYNPATGDFSGEPVIGVHRASVHGFGEQDAVEVGCRVLTGSTVASVAMTLVQDVFSRFAEPYASMKLPVHVRAGWEMASGQVARLTHPLIDPPREPGVGVSDLPVQIVDVERHLRPRGRGGKPERGVAYADLYLVTGAFNGGRRSRLAPSATLDFTGGTTWQARDHEHSRAEDPEDWRWFKVGYIVLCAQIGNYSSIAERTIIDMSSSGALRFSTALSWSTDTVMWLAPHNTPDAHEDQLRHVHIADANRVLERDPGDPVEPFIVQ